MRITKKTTLMLGLLVIALVTALWILLLSGSRGEQPRARRTMTPATMTRVVREELERLQGSWEFVSLEVEGEPKPDADFKKYTVVFKDDQWIVSEGTNIAAQTTIVLDPTASPKAIDAFPPPGKGLPIHGIYSLEGDKLTICDRGEDNGERPASFDEEPNAGLVMIVFQRTQP